MSKDYTIEKIEKPEEVIKRTNGSIALNTIFAKPLSSTLRRQ